MGKQSLLLAALAATVGAAFLLFAGCNTSANRNRPSGFVQSRGTRFLIDGRDFRFVGANVAVMYRDEDRAQMEETLRKAAASGITVVRVWAFGEGGPNDIGPVADLADWPRTHPFRWAPGQWNEEAFVHLDRVLAEARRNNLRVQLCLTNWWRDTGGVTQYLRWAGINDAADDRFNFGINPAKAMLFYTNEETRRLYREHLEKLATRRNTVTGVTYREDPTIFGWELMNEAQALTGRWAERRAWISEMSSYLKSLDPNHLIAPGDWGYRTAAERREWLADHVLPHVDYCDVHNYPKDDSNSFVDSPDALQAFLDNRAAAAVLLSKPLVIGEFGIGPEGFNGFTQAEWFHALFAGCARVGAAGAMFWILTPDPNRGYGVTYSTPRDEKVFEEIAHASKIFASVTGFDPPQTLSDGGHHLVPHQFAWRRQEGAAETRPQMYLRPDKTILYEFKPENALAARFEKLGGGPGYFWGFGVGSIDYRVPERADRRRVGAVIVRAHLQPVPPVDAQPEQIKSRVTLFVDGTNYGSRLISSEDAQRPSIQEWRVDGWMMRLHVMRGLPFTIRFAVTADSDWLYGINISNWPEGYDAHDARPVEVQLVR